MTVITFPERILGRQSRYGLCVLFGRTSECLRIDRLLAETRRGASSALVVSGEPGAGKSSLLRYAVDCAADLHVLSVTGVEAETMFPFAALGRLLPPVLEHLRSIPAAQVAALRGPLSLGTAQHGDRFAVCAATFQLLAAASESSPILVVVDDAQWLDQSTSEALAFSARRLRAEGIGLLVATRSDQGFADLELLPVRGLDEEAAAELLAARLTASPAAEVVRTLTAELAGNPQALAEVGDTLTLGEISGSRPLRRWLSAELTADRIFGPRVAALEREPRQALRVTAVAAGGGVAVVLAVLAAQKISRASLESLEDSGLVSVADGQVRFVHPLLRSAALGGLTPTQMRALHRDVAMALTGPAQEERRAWHLAEAALGQDEDAARALERAADVASGRSGYAAASLALERAAELSIDDRARARRLYASADAARLAGQAESALRLLTRCEGHTTEPGLLAAIAATRGRIELYSGRAGLARAVLQAGASALAGEDPESAAPLLAAAAAAAFMAGDSSGAVILAREAIDSAGTGDANTRLTTRFVLGNALVSMGRAEEGTRWLREAAELFQKVEPGTIDIESTLFVALGMIWIGEAAGARVLVDPTVQRLRAVGGLGQLPFALYVSALADSQLGRLDTGRAAATEAVDLATGTGDVFTLCPALGCLALLEAQRGDEQACRTHAAESLRLRAEASFVDVGRDALDGLGLLELSLGRPERAMSHLEQANRYQQRDGPLIGRVSSFDLVEVCVRADVQVPALFGQLQRLVELDLSPARGALVWRGLALLADEESFDAYFARALELHERAASRFDTARTQLCYGERLRRSGRRRDARGHLAAALDAFQRLGAGLWAERTAAELTAAGQPASVSAHGVGEGLTAQELQVARLAGAGGTNREVAAQMFLSVKTIEMHLGRVYRKLGLRSRTQLANLLHLQETS